MAGQLGAAPWPPSWRSDDQRTQGNPVPLQRSWLFPPCMQRTCATETRRTFPCVLRRRLPKHRQAGSLCSAETMRWRTESWRLALTAPDQFRLKNKLTGKIYAGNANSFEVLVRSGDKTVRMNGADFARRILSRPAPDSLKISYDGAKQLAGVRIEAIYTLDRDAWFVRKHLRVTNGTNSPILICAANVENCRIVGVALAGAADQEKAPCPSRPNRKPSRPPRLMWRITCGPRMGPTGRRRAPARASSRPIETIRRRWWCSPR